MKKNWIIRTRLLQILGPVSKKKIIELLENGTLADDDEICPGNGYWFFVKETDFVERFAKGDEVPGFNPVTEALESQRLVIVKDRRSSEKGDAPPNSKS